ncbi:MAG: sigma 54-interacting transcriptional regulator [Deltaproteobacteria bacterium]|nr:sigma 54-interacting transcriptional regulator [Deltaproteobacteria bacterium]
MPSSAVSASEAPGTQELSREDGLTVRGFAVEVVEGAPPARHQATGASCAIGAHPSNDLVIDDPTVSRFHCELTALRQAVRIRDGGSRNGTIVDGMRIHDAELREGSVIRLGRAALRFTTTVDHVALPRSPRDHFGPLVGASPAMRALFALCERAAASDVTVLIEGETGTGKGAAAEAIHAASARRDRPFVVVDCGALSPTLLDSELFGHERGAFTGADARRIGAFEEADGGTIFLDEIGELPADLQPKLLRVLENREVRRLGQNGWQPVDLRIIAATNRDLRAEVNAGRFRSDLYYRLAVLKLAVPPLRQHPDDLARTIGAILGGLRATPEAAAALTAPDVIARLARAAWPGNVRELRNYLEQAIVLESTPPLGAAAIAAAPAIIDASEPYAAARERSLAAFERGYVLALLRAHRGNVAAAAAAAGMARVYLYRLIRRHDLKR